MHDGIGRAYITVDGKDVFNMCTLKRDFYHDPKEGFYSQVEFIDAAYTYINSPIEEMISSNDALIKILLILDRRIGKRTLESMKEIMSNEEDIVQYFYNLRCSTN